MRKCVLDAARTFGWEWYHTHNAFRSVAGWPDLVLCRPPRIVFAELKVGRNPPTAAQAHWLELLRACGQEAHLWRYPDSWPDEVVSALR